MRRPADLKDALATAQLLSQADSPLRRLVTVADQLGNTAAVCLRTYAHLFPSRGDRVRAAIEGAWATDRAVTSLLPRTNVEST